MAKCKECGDQLPDGASVCGRCGTPADASTAGSAVRVQETTKRSKKKVWLILGLLSASILCFPPLGLLIWSVVHTMHSARVENQSYKEMAQAKQVGLAVLSYSRDNDNRMPPFDTKHPLTPFISKFLRSNSSDAKGEGSLLSASESYIWNSKLSGLDIGKIDFPEAIWMYRSRSEDGTGKYDVVFLDGHVKRFSLELLSQIEKDSSKALH